MPSVKTSDIVKAGCWILLFVIFSGCTKDSYKSGFESNYGDDSYELVKKSRKVYYFEIDPFYEDTTVVEKVGNYALSSEKTLIGKPEKKKIRQLLTVYNNYNTDGLTWACVFNPTFGLEFRQKDQNAFLVISPECYKAKFWIEGEKDVHFIDYSLLVNDLESIFNN
ncbi:MAG: hypothetical protein WBA74_12090 [Cyclobacteriaceae bacterium]